MTTWEDSSGGADWRLELERDRLLPGRLVAGRVTVTARHDVDARGLQVTLRGEEHWRYEVTTTDAQGHAQTERRTGREDLPPEPVLVAGELHLAGGEARTFDLELPVPALGPASLDAEMAGAAWVVEAKLDVPGGRDSSIEVPVRVCQPTALLRAGVVTVGQFALFPAADVAADDVAGSIALEPAPLVAGAPFRGRLTLAPTGSIRVRGVRAELRVKVEATVSGGLDETIVPWSGVVLAGGELGDGVVEFAGTVEDRALPTVELPHGRASATFHVILDRAWARDPHLVRDVAIATTPDL